MSDEQTCPECRHPAFPGADGRLLCVTCRRLRADGTEWHPDEWPPCPWPAGECSTCR